MSAAAGLGSFLFRSSSLPLLVVALIPLLFTCLGSFSRPAGFLLFWLWRGGGWRRRRHIFPEVVTLSFVRVFTTAQFNSGDRLLRRRRRLLR